MPGKVKFIVEGVGTFPYDMLRYDSCYPADGHAVDVITPSFFKSTDGGLKKQAMLICEGEPTADRWRSFGWHVKQTMKLPR